MKVYNKRHGNAPLDAVYVGRPSKFGNQYSHMSGTLAKYRVATRQDAVQKFREFLMGSPDLLRQVREELRGKDLVCWCAPAECHADVLMEVANEE